MKNDMIFVTSQSDWTVVINVPELHLSRTWSKRGVKYPFERDVLEQAFYTPSVGYLFQNGYLVTDDEEFLRDVGLLNEDTKKSTVVNLDETMLKRMIKLMPLAEFKKQLTTLTHDQIEAVADYAIDHYKDFNMDRADVLSKASGKNVLKCIENYKQQEE